jgi:hypothetical protein
MQHYTHTGEGGKIRARDINHAADILARRMYGTRGVVGALRHDNDTVRRDGTITGSTWQAFVGVGPTAAERRNGGNGITGRNVWIYS